MRTFGGPVLFLDKSDINTDEIIPAKYLTEISKSALMPHLLEDLLINDNPLDTTSTGFREAKVVVSRKNFGCGSSREHAVWAFEVNNFHVIIAESFARIFRQNMFNCGILAIELAKQDIDTLFALTEPVTLEVKLDEERIVAKSHTNGEFVQCAFTLNSFDKDLVAAGGWLAYAADKY